MAFFWICPDSISRSALELLASYEEQLKETLAENNDLVAAKNDMVLKEKLEEALAENSKLAAENNKLVAAKNDMVLKNLLLESELTKLKESGDSQDAGSSDAFANLSADSGASSEKIGKLVTDIQGFFVWAGKQLEGQDGSTTTSLLDDAVSLTTQDAQEEINWASRVSLEILVQVCAKIGNKVPEKIGELTGMDAEFLGKMAGKYVAANETLTGGGKPQKRGLFNRRKKETHS